MDSEDRQPLKRVKRAVFFKVLTIALVIFAVSFAVVAVGMSMFSGNGFAGASGEGESTDFQEKISGGIASIFGGSAKEKVYALIIGTDNDATHTDTMVLTCFDPETEKIVMISLPRDTKVTIPADRVEELQDMGSPVPSSGVCKLTEVYHYAYNADKEIAVDYLEKQIDDLLGIKVDFYVKVDLEAFSYLVNEIGGVEFDVPQRMYYYDPMQDLLIDLQPGVQTLEGKDAEGLVRFRSYPGGDVTRMKVQQEFMKAFIEQALSKEKIVKNATAMISTAFKYVKTDFELTSLPGYIKYIDTFSPGNIETYTLPIERTEMIGTKDYVILDEKASKDLIDDVFFGKTDIVEKLSQGLDIQVLNGGGVTGLAKAGKDLLELNGFAVKIIGDYTGVKTDNNRIFVSERGMGEDLKKIIKNSDIIYDPTIDSQYDIIVVIGKSGLD